MTISLIDTHAHLHAKEFDEDRAEVLSRATAAGIRKIILIGAGDGWNSVERAKNTVLQFGDTLWYSAGIHPCSADEALDADRLKEAASAPRVVALGETGLDYYWRNDNAAAQVAWFRTHIEIACQLQKPLIIHSRNSGTECLEVLKDSRAREVGGVFHCFAENAAFARSLLDLNFMVSFPGIVTFKNAETVRDAVRQIPLSQILIETDSPYLAPVPYRGKRCESAFMLETARVIAQIKDISLEELAEVTSASAEKVFNLR